MIQLQLKNIARLLLFIAFHFAGNAFSQPHLIFDHLTSSDGLSQSVAKVILKDSYGYMWFGTYHGLNRYDGQVINSFVHELNTPNTFGLTSINCLLEDRHTNIWIGSENGLSRYHSKTGKFKYFTSPLKDQKVISLFKDSNHEIWVVTPDGLHSVDPDTDSTIAYPLNRMSEPNLPPIQTAALFGADTLLLTAGKYLIMFYAKQLRFEYIKLNIADDMIISTSMVLPSKEIWLGTYRAGILRIRENKVVEQITVKTPGYLLPHNQIRTFYVDPLNRIWVGTQGGLCLFDEKGNKFFTYISSNQDKNTLLSSYIRSVYLDNLGNLWVGTVGGVNKHSRNKQFFRHYQTSGNYVLPKDRNAQSASDVIWDIEIDSDSIMWISTMNNGVRYLPKNELGKKDFSTIYAPQRGLLANTCNQINEISPGILYFATEAGLQKYTKRTNTFTTIPLTSDKREIDCYSLVHDKKNNLLWIATNNGLFYYNLISQTATYCFDSRFPEEKKEPIPISMVYLDKDRLLWLGKDNGISVLNTNLVDIKNTSESISYNSAVNIKELNSNSIYSVIEDNFKNLYIASNYGLGIYSKDSGKFQFIALPKEYQKLIPFELVIDSKNNLWCGTNVGLLKINTRDTTYILYGASDGLFTNEFNQLASFVDNTGEIYMGGINGFNVFHPDSIPKSPLDMNILFNAFYLFGKEIEIDTSYDGRILLDTLINFKSEIELDHFQNFFAIAFNTFNYSHSGKITYAYKLENFDTDWNYTSSQPLANYTNVSPGTYIFRIKSTNSEKVWLNNERQIIIRILPPFWQAWQFQLAITLIIFTLVFLYLRLRFRKLRSEKHALESEIRRRTIDIFNVKKEIEQSSAFISAVIQNAGIGMAVTSEEGNFVIVNEALQNILGYTELELLQLDIGQITPIEWHSQDDEIYAIVRESHFSVHEKQLIKKNGDKIWVSVSASLLNYEGKISIISQISDISAQKANEKELKKYREHLEVLVEQRTQALLEAKEKAENADRLKSSFLSNLSHELRTPMNAINGFVQLIKDKTWSQDEHEDFLQHIVDSTFNLLNLIEDIVLLSKLDSNSVTVNTSIIEVNDLLHNLHQTLKSRANGQVPISLNISSEVQRPTFIESDQKMLSKILTELAGNAIKFTLEGNIVIGLEFEYNTDNLIFYVKDTGIGISSDQLKVLFSSFGKYNSTDQQIYRGIGIGLNIVKRISALLKIDIKVISDQGEGTKFWFSIPKFQVPMHTMHEPEIIVLAANTENSPLVLIVEDEELNYIFLREILLKLHCRILWAKDGLEAIEAVHANPSINLIFMDIKLPVMDGIEATIAIKQFSKIPIIAQTAYALATERNKIIEAGCDDFVTKPILMNELHTVLKKYNIVI